MNDETKAARYEARTPGVDIPMEQKAERYDRLQVKEKHRGMPRTKRRKPVGMMVVPSNSACWCDCGRFKNHDGDCK